MIPVVFWGGTGQARVLREAVCDGNTALVAIFDSRDIESPFADVPLFQGEPGFARWERLYRGERPVRACVAIGGALGRDRLARTRWLKTRGCLTDTVIHRTAFVANDARIGDACQLLALSATCANAQLGEAVVINTSASIDHDCTLGDGVHIGPGATLAGEVTVMDFAFVGAGATILPRVRIGKDAIVGAGAIVTHDVPDGAIVVGNPAHPYRKDHP